MKQLIGIILLSLILLASCGEDKVRGVDAAHSSEKDKDIREYNLKRQRELSGVQRTPCDPLSVEEYVIKNYPDSGSYLIETDKTNTYSLPSKAVVSIQNGNKKLIFALIAKSKPGERLVEKKNVVGYESSFINLDSTKLGTAFFYLTMFECNDGQLVPIWEAEVPSHGGFNSIKMNTWAAKGIPYLSLNFEDGIISGHRDYNYFFNEGFYGRPHLLETYLGLVHKRTIANINNDIYPDYYEYRFDESRLAIRDSIPFSWDVKKKEYLSKVNSRWSRKY